VEADWRLLSAFVVANASLLIVICFVCWKWDAFSLIPRPLLWNGVGIWPDDFESLLGHARVHVLEVTRHKGFWEVMLRWYEN